jgi:hypothetical protein
MAAATVATSTAPMTAAAVTAAAVTSTRYGRCSAASPAAAAAPSAAVPSAAARTATVAARRSHAVAIAPAAIVVSIRFVDAAHVTLIDVTAAAVADTDTPGHRNQQTADRKYAP